MMVFFTFDLILRTEGLMTLISQPWTAITQPTGLILHVGTCHCALFCAIPDEHSNYVNVDTIGPEA